MTSPTPEHCNAVATKAQEAADRFYTAHGPCCAGCDWWHGINSRIGECHRSAPVPAEQRYAVLGMEGVTMELRAGHVMTQRDHHCGDFKDEFDWASLAPHYLRRIGRTACPGCADARALDDAQDAAGGNARETNTPESRDSQHVLKAEAARPDATDREIPGMASPDGGPMGVGQPAAAGPVGAQDADQPKGGA